MRNFKKLTSIAAASALALSLGTAANAAVFIDTGNGGGDIVSPSGPVVNLGEGVEFINNDLNLAGAFIVDNNTASIVVGAGVTAITLDFDVDQALPNGNRARGIQNFSLMVEGDMGASFMLTGITNAAGVFSIPAINEFAVMAGETLTFVFSGTAFANDTQFTPGYSVGAFGIGSEVPLPAAGLLFGTAAIGGAMARRKRKAA